MDISWKAKILNTIIFFAVMIGLVAVMQPDGYSPKKKGYTGSYVSSEWGSRCRSASNGQFVSNHLCK